MWPATTSHTLRHSLQAPVRKQFSKPGWCGGLLGDVLYLKLPCRIRY